MKLTFKTQREADSHINEMAKEAGLSANDIAEIAVYNLIAVWMREKEQKAQEIAAKMDVSVPVPAVVGSGKRTPPAL